MSEQLHLLRALPVVDMGLQGSDGRTAVLKLLTYGTDYQVSDDGMRIYSERWRHGAFKRSFAHNGGVGIPMTYEHNIPGQPRALPVGGSKRAWEDGSAVMLEGRISRTSTGDDLVELMRDGVVGGVSIDCWVFRSNPMVGGFERIEARLRGVALTTMAQYHDAELVAMRSEPDPVGGGTPLLDALSGRMSVFDL